MSEIRVSLPFTPHAHQRAAHAFRLAFRFLVLVWHRRAGKTVFAILELILGAVDCTKERGHFGYICPLRTQAKSTAWEYLKHFTRDIPRILVNESELYVQLPNGARIRLFGADAPEALKGLYFDGVVLDEVADMKPVVWGEAVRPMLSDRNGWAIFIGTPKGVNLFSELYFRALKDEEGWKADLRRGEETGMFSPEELASMKREMTPAQYAQEVDCDFGASAEDVLLKLEDVLAAQRRTLGEAEYMFAAKVLGVDVARFGGDRNCLFPRQGLVAYRPRILKLGMDTMAVAGQVCQMVDSWKPDATFIDEGGIGGGVIDRCLQLGYPVIPVNFAGHPTQPRFQNKRAEMWWELSDWVRRGGCLPDIPELQQDLPGPRYTYKNSNGKVQLESKDDMCARGLPSPDVGDALACTFFMPVMPMADRTRHFNNPNAVSDYDPYAEGR